MSTPTTPSDPAPSDPAPSDPAPSDPAPSDPAPSGPAPKTRPTTTVGTDELAILGIECRGHHGVFDFEKRDGQPFLIDLVLGLDTTRAAASDDLRDTVDYGSLVAQVKTAVESDPVDLIETLADRISGICLLDDRVEWAKVTVHKPDAPIDATFSDVALTITRKREVQQ